MQWLGVGRVRVGFNINGVIYYAHYFNNANNLGSVYMSTPNLPVRYEVSSTGGSVTLDQICCTVQSEGGNSQMGTIRSINSRDLNTDADTTGSNRPQ